MLHIDLPMNETGDLLGISKERQEELHILCPTIVDSGCAGNLNCAETVNEINKVADILTCKELIFITFKLGRIFQVAQNIPPKKAA